MATAICLTACSDGVVEDEGGGPESIAIHVYHGSRPAPSLPPNTEIEPGVAAARWNRVGRSLVVTTWGSGSCPTVPVAIDVDSTPDAVITLVLSDDYEGVCTADLGPYASVVRLPEPFTVRDPVELIVKNAGEPTVRIRL